MSVDVRIEDQGSLVLFHLETDEARDFFQEYVDTPDYSWLGGAAVAVEHRVADDLIEVLRGNGLEVV